MVSPYARRSKVLPVDLEAVSVGVLAFAMPLITLGANLFHKLRCRRGDSHAARLFAARRALRIRRCVRASVLYRRSRIHW